MSEIVLNELSKLQSSYDIVIVGAGMVGASFAAALNNTNLKILLIDKTLPPAIAPNSPPDLRVSSINLGAIRWLKQQGIWQYIDQQRIQDYQYLSAYEAAGTSIEFDAQSLNENKLGCFIENRHLQLAATQTANCEKITAEIQAIHQDTTACYIKLTTGEDIHCKLIVGADGGTSFVAKQTNFAEYGWRYRQDCLSINIQFDLPPRPEIMSETWQKFRPQGPIAFLPLFNNYGTLIIYDSPEAIKQFKQLGEHQFQLALESLFVDTHIKSLPPFQVLNFASFPLTKRTIHSPFRNRVLLLGDAAHNIHPLAGQGVNLGLRDVAAASHNILDLVLQNKDFSCEGEWLSYTRKRQIDVHLTSGMMDATYKLFSNGNPLFKLVRTKVLNSINNINPAKKMALHFALGLNDPYV